jgi:hypothetical protein
MQEGGSRQSRGQLITFTYTVITCVARPFNTANHGCHRALHVFPSPNGPSAPGDTAPVHALLYKHTMSRSTRDSRGYVQYDIFNTFLTSRLTIPTRPQPRRLPQRFRILPSEIHEIASPTQRIARLTPNQPPQSRAPLPYPRRLARQARPRETHPGSRRAFSAAPLRAQPALLCHTDAEQPLANLHTTQSRR